MTRVRLASSLGPLLLLVGATAPGASALAQAKPTAQAVPPEFLKRLAAVEAYERDAEALRAREGKSLVALGQWAKEKGVQDPMAALQPYLDLQEPASRRRDVLTAVEGATGAAGTPLGAGEWDSKLAAWRREWGKQWEQSASRAARAGLRDYALRAAREAVCRDPDSSAARKALGQERVGREWIGAWQAERMRSGWKLDSRAGWVHTRDTPKLEQGMLPSKRGWEPAEAVLRERETWDGALTLEWGDWQIETTLSVPETLEICKNLEEAAHWIRERHGGRFEARFQKPCRCMMYKNPAEYEGEIDLVHGGDRHLKDMVGFFSPRDNALHISPSNSKGGELRGTVRHEALHALWSTARRESGGTSEVGATVRESVASAVEDFKLVGIAGRVTPLSRSLGETLAEDSQKGLRNERWQTSYRLHGLSLTPYRPGWDMATQTPWQSSSCTPLSGNDARGTLSMLRHVNEESRSSPHSESWLGLPCQHSKSSGPPSSTASPAGSGRRRTRRPGSRAGRPGSRAGRVAGRRGQAGGGDQLPAACAARGCSLSSSGSAAGRREPNCLSGSAFQER